MFLTDYAGPDRKKRNSGNDVSEWIHIWSLHTLYTIRTHNAVHRKLSSTISAIWLWHVCLTASPSFHLDEIPTYPHNVCNVFKSMIYVYTYIYVYIRTSFFREEMACERDGSHSCWKRELIIRLNRVKISIWNRFDQFKSFH